MVSLNNKGCLLYTSTLEESSTEVQMSILSSIEPERAADILELMDPDEAADLLADMPDQTSEALLNLMEADDASEAVSYTHLVSNLSFK